MTEANKAWTDGLKDFFEIGSADGDETFDAIRSEIGMPKILRCDTFESLGMLTNDAGLVISFANGRRVRLTVDVIK